MVRMQHQFDGRVWSLLLLPVQTVLSVVLKHKQRWIISATSRVSRRAASSKLSSSSQPLKVTRISTQNNDYKEITLSALWEKSI